MNKTCAALIVVGVCTFTGYVIRKLNDIQREIEHFENAKGVMKRKTYEELLYKEIHKDKTEESE